MKNIDVVIPVFNNLDQLKILLNSINIQKQYINKVIIIDDYSELETADFLINLSKEDKQIWLIKNTRNLGFTESANKGMRASTLDVLLINTDVILPRGAIKNLSKALNRSQVASVTALSDLALGSYSSVSFAYPINLNFLNRKFVFTIEIDLSDTGLVNIYNYIWRFFSLFVNKKPFIVPSCVGYCVLINREALKRVGYFDEVIFPFGYGEENDWSFRCSRNDFSHLLSWSVIVHHSQGKSFKGRTALLSKLHSNKLKNIYPEYPNCFIYFEEKRLFKILKIVTNITYKFLTKII
jgi:GT2 family glycosyltransferase